MEYEGVTKKAAKISAEAGRQLHKTRTTQSAAVIACILSAATAGYGVFTAGATSWVALLNAVVCGGAWFYVGDFWGGAAKAPFGIGGRQYNDAVRATQQVLVFLQGLGAGWGIVGIGRMVGIL